MELLIVILYIVVIILIVYAQYLYQELKRLEYIIKSKEVKEETGEDIVFSSVYPNGVQVDLTRKQFNAIYNNKGGTSS